MASTSPGQHWRGQPVRPTALADWHLLVADFVVNAGVPSLQNVRDITAPNSNWNEVLDWSPDGSSLLVSSDNNLPYDYGADDWTVNVTTGAYTDITNQPKLWDEHGSFSPTGKKVAHSQQIPPTLLPLDASLPYAQWAPLIGTEIWVSNRRWEPRPADHALQRAGPPLTVA